MNVSFFDVGQGDSIALEWINESKEIGIIDCCKKGNSNPVLDYLKKKQYSKIKFLIISHWHLDHYSGLLELLEYIESSKIVIEHFLHTGQAVIFQLIGKTGSSTDAVLLNSIYKKSDALIKSKQILKPDTIYDTRSPIQLADNLSIVFCGPNYTDYDKVQRNGNKVKAFDNYNKIAAITKVVSKSNYILFTSDSVPYTQKRAIRNSDTFKEHTLKLTQAPHHGSDKNFLPSFWSAISKEKHTPVVFSVGQHLAYQLPKKKVVEGFINLQYDIHSTNCVNGINEIFNCQTKKKQDSKIQTELILNIVSDVIEDVSANTVKNKYNGDQLFNIQLQ